MARQTQSFETWHIGALEQLFRQTKLFSWTLTAKSSNKQISGYPDNWRGFAENGLSMMTSGSGWRTDGCKFQKFDWLRDLRSFGGSDSRGRARTLIKNWIDKNSRWHPYSWRPDIMGTRVANLVFCYDWYGSSADDNFQKKLSTSIKLQARCLALDWRRLKRAEDRVTAFKGLFIAESALDTKPEELSILLGFLIPLIENIVHPDGGHKDRMPDLHLMVLRDLMDIRNAYPVTNLKQKKWLDITISKMAAVCRLWRHADGQFARFNGAGRVHTNLIEETLVRSGQKGKVVNLAPDTGFVRISSGRSTVVMDVGEPVKNASITGLGTLGFEFSVGQSLLIINPGQTAKEKNFQRLLQSTNAHSTLTIDGYNSTDFDSNRIATIKQVEIGPAKGGYRATADHSGYQNSHGIIHRRTLYLANSGGNLRGLDHMEYTGAPGEIGRLASIRFHLHPWVTAAMLRDHRILIKIRGNRSGWLFRTNGTAVLDSSLFFNSVGRMNCQQIVVTMPINNIRTVGTIEVKWAFQRDVQQ